MAECGMLIASSALLKHEKQLTMNKEGQGAEEAMLATGELIRMMNYVDDIAATARRIQVGVQGMTEEERRRLAEYMRKSDPNFIKMLEALEKI
jgi:hypothetical protein